MARKKDPLAATADGPSFEDALGDLEALVEAMEHEQLPLEELVSSYEKGSALLNHCEAILKTASGRIELITLRNQHETGPGDEAKSDPAPALTPVTAEGPNDNDDDDIRLF
ncbi:MAG: exodeoxyribonuclease VII small subunit [Verrucomicrobia bacterium]|nr:exodeoxyribonuclease VII small subunit [Verrucomicrobiota bacterium]